VIHSTVKGAVVILCEVLDLIARRAG
jgi:hypothetical protein